ncbi:MAG: glycoside hydrolase family 16 [Chthonomonadales bacterium]|nr:glycoside hydrolase family 16 [Chthonomonadales bacterium]
MNRCCLLRRVVCLSLLLFGVAASAAEKPTLPIAGSRRADVLSLLDMGAGVEKRVSVSSGQVSVSSTPPTASGVQVTIQPGKEEYPGIAIKPAGAPWNLAAFGHVEAQVVNTGLKPLSLALRVDDAGDWSTNPTNTESIYLKPGEAGVIKTIFGYSYGYKPSHALKSSAVVNLLLFTTKTDSELSFRLTALSAGGASGEKPPTAPDAVRIRPIGGMLLGPGIAFDAAKQVNVQQGAQAVMGGGSGGKVIRITFPAAQDEASVRVLPPTGRWDLRQALQVVVKVHNNGQVPVTPRVRLESNGGATDWVVSGPLMPGQTANVTVPFIPPTPTDLGVKQDGKRFTSDACSAITLGALHGDTVRELRIDAISVGMPPALNLPAWVGQRPPVQGDWVKTLDEEFDGPTLNSSLWNIYAENYWDKPSHFSKNNVLLGGGVVKLHYEKKRGYHNDDPKKQQTDYTTGYLDTYGKWVQRYGYFEARVKLPDAPGLWPAFWMMPDRGVAAGEQWKRQDTNNHGMEFDIMEYLTRWGPYRYNVAMHYDGYEKEHKSIGSDNLYVQPDKDGFLTCGLLWTPGLAVYYCNGRELLRWENPRISDVPSDLMFDMVQGGWDNDPIDDSRLPADLIVDYVRVWQRKDLASPLDTKRLPASSAHK